MECWPLLGSIRFLKFQVNTTVWVKVKRTPVSITSHGEALKKANITWRGFDKNIVEIHVSKQSFLVRSHSTGVPKVLKCKVAQKAMRLNE